MTARAPLLSVGAAALVFWAGCDVKPSADHPLVGRPAPLFTATTLDDAPFDLAQYLGKNVIILDFWATWCGPCAKALPTLAEVSSQYKDRGVELFAVDIQESPEDVRQFLASTSLNLSVVMDRDGAISNRYLVDGIPQTVIIGKDGTVRFVHVGLSSNLRAELTHQLDELVAGEPTAALPAGPTTIAQIAPAPP